MIPNVLNPETSGRLVLTLSHFLWQGAAIAMAAWFCLRLMRSASAQMRYAVALTALLLMAVCPVATFLLVRPPMMPQEQAAHGPATPIEPVAQRVAPRLPSEPEAGPTTAPAVVRHAAYSGDLPPVAIAPAEPRRNEAVTSAPEPKQAAAVAAVAMVESSPSQPMPANSTGQWNAWLRLTPHITVAYLAGVLLMLLRLLIAVHGGRRLRRLAWPVPDDLLSLVARQAERIGLRAAPVVAMCAKVIVPTVVGVLRPTILLPLGLMTGLTPAQVAAVLTHELAHIRRYDPLVNILQRIIEAALFFHPAVWWLSRRIRIERENCCDDIVVATGHEPIGYAASLLHLAELALAGRAGPSVASPAAISATGSGRKPSRLASRIGRLIGVRPDDKVRLSRCWPIVLLLLAGLLVAIPLACRPTLSQLPAAVATSAKTLPPDLKAATLAIRAGNGDNLKSMLDAGLDPNAAEDGWPLLCHAVAVNQVDCVKLLLAAGAKVSAKNQYGQTPLPLACDNLGYHGSSTAVDPKGARAVGIIRLLLGAGADPNDRGAHWPEIPPLLHLLKEGAQVDEPGQPGYRLKGQAAVELLLAAKADPNLADQNGVTPLHLACGRNLPQAAAALLAHGASVEARCAMGGAVPGEGFSGRQQVTPLEVAAVQGCNAIIEMLLARGAKVNLGDADGQTPIFLAARSGCIDTVELFKAHGADVNIAVNHQTPLGLAVARGMSAAAELLLAQGAAVNPGSPEVWTPLQSVALSRVDESYKTPMVKLLLSHGAKMDIYSASGLGRADDVKKIIQANPALTHASKLGKSPLDFARRYHCEEVARLLVAGGTKPDLECAAWLGLVKEVAANVGTRDEYTDFTGSTSDAMIEAAVGGQDQVIKLLLSRGFKLAEDSRSLVHAAEHGHLGTVKLLLAKRADVNARDFNSALHWAAHRGDIEMAKVLLAHGADIDITNEHESEERPLDYAEMEGKTEMVKFLLSRGAKTDQELYATTGPDTEDEFHGDIDAFLKRWKAKPGNQRQLDNALAAVLADYSWALIAAKKPQAESNVKKLLDLGADPNVKDPWHRPFLWFADEPIANMLLARGATVDFHAACAQGMIDRVHHTLTTQPELVDAAHDGITPISLAAGHGQAEVVKLLLARGAKPTQDALIWAISEKHKEVVATLLDAGLESDARSLRLAMDWGDRNEIVHLLQAHRAKQSGGASNEPTVRPAPPATQAEGGPGLGAGAEGVLRGLV